MFNGQMEACIFFDLVKEQVHSFISLISLVSDYGNIMVNKHFECGMQLKDQYEASVLLINDADD
jgi:hypothetical protein